LFWFVWICKRFLVDTPHPLKYYADAESLARTNVAYKASLIKSPPTRTTTTDVGTSKTVSNHIWKGPTFGWQAFFE